MTRPKRIASSGPPGTKSETAEIGRFSAERKMAAVLALLRGGRTIGFASNLGANGVGRRSNPSESPGASEPIASNTLGDKCHYIGNTKLCHYIVHWRGGSDPENPQRRVTAAPRRISAVDKGSPR